MRYVADTDRYRIIAGECRFNAAKHAGLTEIPCWVRTPKENEILLAQIVENWQRSDLNPFELADSLAILRDANGYTQQQLAEETGKSKGEISKLFTILDLNPDAQKIAREDTAGRITKRHLYSLARLPATQQTLVLQRVYRDELSAIDTEKLVTRIQEKQDRPRKAGAPVTRRAFATKNATVVITYRKKDVGDTDLLMTLHDVQQQIIERSNNSVDLA